MGLETALFAGANAFGGSALGGTLFNAALNAGGISSALSTGFSVLSGVSSLIGGMQQKQEAKNQAALATQEARMQAAEQVRLADREARFEQENADKTRRAQKLAYLKSGVTLEGTPFLALEETRRRGKENVDEILAAGSAGSRAALAEGRIRAQSMKSTGRQAFIQGLTNAGTSLQRLM